MIAPFVYEASPARVVFGAGSLGRLGAELDRLGVTRALLLSTPQQADFARAVQRQLGSQAGGVFTEATMHTPAAVTAAAAGRLASLGCDGMVALGGGSTIGLGKALAKRTGLPHLAVPTTYAGSEVTPILGETEAGRKVTQRSPSFLPQTVIYDVELTLSLPPGLSATSGMNAIAHAVEALYTQDANPVISMMAEEGMRALAHALPLVVQDPAAVGPRTEAQYGAWLCGTCLGAVGMALHHKICHVLGGTFNLPHAETHTVVLPHAAAFNQDAAPGAMRRIARALNVDQAQVATALFDLARALGAPAGLRELGMPKDGLDQAAELMLQDRYWNPRPVEREALLAMLRNAWAGARPQLV